VSAVVFRAERGSASVLAVVLVGALSVAAVLVAAVGAVVADQRRVASAADLAALAGAAAVQAGRDGCARAGAIAHRNAARIASCVVSGDVVLVRTTRRTAPLLGRRVTVSSAARAGPVDAAP
jgi:secretion/DNA translocation related TadE-like protein